MFQGIVVKAYNGFYYVKNTSKITMCTLRGRIKKERFSLLVGDRVVYTIIGQDKGVIEEILPRRSILARPMVANVDQVIITFAAANPGMKVELLDRFLVLAELAQLKIYLCINKTELVDRENLQPVIELYESIGYDVIALSAKTEMGITNLRQILYDQISVFAGPSGVGKSTILNLIEPGFQLETGEVSEKIGRGKHTTRFAQLLPLTGGGYVVDTPGFSFTEFSNLKENELTYCFREIALRAAQCKFTSCLHVKEPQCAVKEAVLSGKIAQSRYDSYLAILEELKEQSNKF